MAVTPQQRFAELDWLRIGLILAVFTHHVFMPFNGDDWHVMNQQSSKLLDDIMVYFEQLRLPTLFTIAGAGSVLLLGKLTAGAFLLNKLKRLLIPLLIGMMFITPPQAYFESPEHYASLWDAYQQRILLFDNKHLWFVEFLIVFMLLAIPVYWLLRHRTNKSLTDLTVRLCQYRFSLMIIGAVVVLIRGGLKLSYPEQHGSIENLSVSVFYLLFFLAGMLFMSRQEIWTTLRHFRRTNLCFFVFFSLCFYIYYLGDFSFLGSLTVRWQIWWALCALVSWSAMLVMLGYGSQYLISSPSWLRQSNELIYPFYILHQTVIVALGYYIVQWDAAIAAKSVSLFMLSLLLTTGLCYFVIRPFNPMRFLFGLKQRRSERVSVQS
ncbi:acyltransferase family protein [Alteromonas lipolytica]|uniref:Acyltransferase 3 domain-containing protein n=1 Tax=Alteromonas lipolytica TaxID=1856405 RepID=A0A1E8F9G1_9ALTE|nr:acyltransferase family protein [Alteromonas lipolytica]OFI32540.1 hypothetical protein BFC17_05110 [Alteromonas lipolytica]GGF75251.1 hypothetical protein GCM10011338_29210 [Alteromonas lipolytica]